MWQIIDTLKKSVANHKISLGNLAPYLFALAPGPVALTRGDLEATGALIE